MPFSPATEAVKLRTSPTTEAFAWLKAIQPEEPSGELRTACQLARPPEPVVPAGHARALPRGPLQPHARCPATGRALALHVFRDLTGVLLREPATSSGPLEVLPAMVALPSELFDETWHTLPWDAREEAPRIRLQGHPGGLRWEAVGCTADEDALARHVARSVETAAAAILAAEPIADPRIHDRIPDGARFAPFARWPKPQRQDPQLIALEAAVRALAGLRAWKSGREFREILLCRQMPGEPWRNTHLVPATGSICAGGRDREFDRALRTLISGPQSIVRDSLRFGPGGETLLRLRDCGPPESAHASIAARRQLAALAPSLDLGPLLSQQPLQPVS